MNGSLLGRHPVQWNFLLMFLLLIALVAGALAFDSGLAWLGKEWGREEYSHGYLLVLVAVCVSMLSISFLRLAAKSARADDDAEEEVGQCAAYYAAESGLLAAELKLRKQPAPPAGGQWLVGALETSGARYTVDVTPDAKSKTEFVIRSKGQVDGEGGKKLTSIIEAEVAQGPGKTWVIRWRKKS